MFQFPKNQKLCSKKLIQKLFENGEHISEYPLRFIWNLEEEKKGVQIKKMVVVPKKQIKLASQRNTLKRRIKEGYRLQKRELEFVLKTNKKELTLAILYQSKEIHNYNM